MNLSPLELTLLLLACSVLGVVAFRMMHLPPMLGYLVVGILIGPNSVGWVDASHTTSTLAEFGVVFLMFSIGLEFSLPKLVAMRRVVFGLGMAQVAATVAVTMLFGWLISTQLGPDMRFSWQASLALGGALAMSSTAIVSKMLTERLELESAHGRKILGILLFQDLAVVPLLILLPALGSHSAGGSGNLLVTLAVASGKAVVVLALLFFFGQRLVRKWFHVVVKRRSQELFMLNLLLVTLGAAWITEIAGLSMALGAFVAGMLISETEYKHQVEEDIKPFRDVLLGLFFVTVGMMLNLRLVVEYWWFVLALLAALIFLKFVLIAGVAKLFGATDGVSMRAGLALAQAGEFGFVLLKLAGNHELMPSLVVQLILASMVLSMLIAPLLIEKSDVIVMKFSANEWMMQSLALTKIATRTMKTQKHVIIAGFGRSGQSLAKLLEAEKVPYHALDLDPERVQAAQSAGSNVSYGDAGRKESLVAAGVYRAAVLVVTYANTPGALRVLHMAHELAPNLQVIVRSHDDTDLDALRAAGAAEVVPEAMEGSLMLASHALVMLGLPVQRVVGRVQATRDARYAVLRGFFRGEGDTADNSEHSFVRLHSVVLTDEAEAIDKPLGQFDLGQFKVEVTAVRRGKGQIDATPELVLQAGDVVVLRGTAEGVGQAEGVLLK